MEAVARRAKRGFNLIEAAIVLAVVGGVIGAIWVAASAVQKSMNLNKDQALILQAVEKTRDLFKNNSGGMGSTSFIQALAVDMGIIPSSLLKGGVVYSYSGYKLKAPSIISWASGYIGVYVNDLDKAGCIWLATHLSASRDLNLMWVMDSVSYDYTEFDTFPVDATAIANAIGSSPGCYEIGFNFNL